MGEECFAELARQRAEDADVVVVNTHLYGAHLASGGHVLPEHDVVVFDEAHELEDVAAASLGLELGAGRFRALARNSRSLTTDRDAIDQVDDAGLVLERALAPWLGKRLPATLPDDLVGALTLAAERVRRLTGAVREGKGDDARKARALQAAGHLAGDIGFVLEASDSDVVWVEGPAHAPSLHIAPVDVGEVLAEKLWSGVTAILTSATIPNNLASRVGIDADACETLDVGSPFDYEENTLLYCAAHLPDPRSADYEAAMLVELEALLRAAEGRTLALFTSWRAMNAAADALRDDLPWPVLTQSDLPKPALVAAFSGDEHASLFATMGFWQGVDVPGRSLSQVIIDKLPFARPDDPLLDARRERAGAAAFRLIDLPRAATLLAQGAGRLVRTATDRGVVAVLDPRLAKAGYRWDLVRALPPMKRTKDRADVEAFFSDLRDQ
jgi:ATP-dependent DNA helicase DinG